MLSTPLRVSFPSQRHIRMVLKYTFCSPKILARNARETSRFLRSLMLSLLNCVASFKGSAIQVMDTYSFGNFLNYFSKLSQYSLVRMEDLVFLCSEVPLPMFFYKINNHVLTRHFLLCQFIFFFIFLPRNWVENSLIKNDSHDPNTHRSSKNEVVPLY